MRTARDGAIGVAQEVKRGVAWVIDRLADLGERMPGVSQVTITAAGASITVTPKPATPPAPVVCPHCGKP